MPFLSFPANQLIKTMATSETVHAGGFTLSRDQELRYGVVTLFKSGTAGGSERLRLKIFHDADLTKLYATGAWSTVATAVGAASHWIGKLRLGFDTPVNVETPEVYHFGIEPENYTRSGDAFYLGFSLDQPIRVNSHAGALGLSLELYGDRGVRY